jgi:hypothetical protein
MNSPKPNILLSAQAQCFAINPHTRYTFRPATNPQNAVDMLTLIQIYIYIYYKI